MSGFPSTCDSDIDAVFTYGLNEEPRDTLLDGKNMRKVRRTNAAQAMTARDHGDHLGLVEAQPKKPSYMVPIS